MESRTSLIDTFRQEMSKDYVGLWHIQQVLEDQDIRGANGEGIISIVEELLSDSSVEVGQFREDRFEPWRGSVTDRIDRLRSELAALGRKPTVGDVCWLVQNSE